VRERIYEIVFWPAYNLCMHHDIPSYLQILRRVMCKEQKELQVKLQIVRGQDGWRQRCEFDQASQELQLLGSFFLCRIFPSCSFPFCLVFADLSEFVLACVLMMFGGLDRQLKMDQISSILLCVRAIPSR